MSEQMYLLLASFQPQPHIKTTKPSKKDTYRQLRQSCSAPKRGCKQVAKKHRVGVWGKWPILSLQYIVASSAMAPKEEIMSFCQRMEIFVKDW